MSEVVAKTSLIILMLGVVACVLALFSAQSEAHGQGYSFEKMDGGYLVDVGYSNSPVVANSQIRFDFSLFADEQKSSPVEFSNVWVRIENEEGLYFAGAVYQPFFGQAGFTYRFTDPGEYSLFVRFEQATSSLVESKFTFTVESVGTPENQKFILTILIALLFGMGITMVLRKILVKKSVASE